MSWLLETLGAVTLWRPRDTPPGTLIAATTRLGGVSVSPYDRLNLGRSTADSPEAVDENRRRVLDALGFDPSRLATAGQVHGVRIVNVLHPGLHPESDALLTTEPGLALAVSGADCLPIMFAAGEVVAAAHSGWRGTVSGMPTQSLTAVLARAGVTAADVRVYLGPCIGPCCYRVGDDVAGQFPDRAVSRRNGITYVDLAAATRLQLERAGVPAEAILDPPACTSCATELCFSHRRDRGLTGRHWAIAARQGPKWRTDGGRV